MSIFALERAADRKSKSIAFARKENAWQFLCKTKFCVRIVIIDKAKRHVDDRHLHPKFDANTGLEILKFSKF